MPTSLGPFIKYFLVNQKEGGEAKGVLRDEYLFYFLRSYVLVFVVGLHACSVIADLLHARLAAGLLRKISATFNHE